MFHKLAIWRPPAKYPPSCSGDSDLCVCNSGRPAGAAKEVACAAAASAPGSAAAAHCWLVAGAGEEPPAAACPSSQRCRFGCGSTAACQPKGNHVNFWGRRALGQASNPPTLEQTLELQVSE